MKITETLDITYGKSGEWKTVFQGQATVESDADRIQECELIYRATRGVTDRAQVYEDLVNAGMINIFVDGGAASASIPVEDQLKSALDSMIKFFTEFEFNPSFRFVNSLALKSNNKEKVAYINDYFKLLDSPYVNEVREKMKSREFKSILKTLEMSAPKQQINQRFKVYYGPAGTGKTTQAQIESNNRCLVCNNTMLPSDIMEDFVFENGAPTFQPSLLWRCMENGEKITLDEINLLPFDSLRFLQGVLDGKKSFNYKGQEVHINDGFEVIGTMNLNIGGAVYGLPEPLVDRGYAFKEFTLTAEQLMDALK